MEVGCKDVGGAFFVCERMAVVVDARNIIKHG